MPVSEIQMHTSCSIYKDLKRWADESGVYISTVTNAALELLREAGVAPKTKQYAKMKLYIIMAALRALGLDVGLDTINEILAGRAGLRVERLGER